MDAYEGYDAVVFDLDGTVAHLDVDWRRVDEETAAIVEDHGFEPTESAWAALDVAEREGFEGVHELLCDHERRGAERSTRLPAADDLRALADDGVAAAVCSLNCEAAVRVALDAHGLADAVGATVGRDSVATRKPDPEPLLAAIDRVGAVPERALFVGDSERDELTAERAGVDYRYVGDGPTEFERTG
ncbi:MAG: HAD family hydrolase [Haloferacaceae archaeon]